MSDDRKKPGGQPELTTRQVIDLLARDPRARPYAVTALGGLAMTFLVLFMNGSDLGGVLVVLFGLAAMVLRWVAAPPFLVLIVAYFLLFPFGWPDPGVESPFQIRTTHFQVADMALVMAVLVYLRAQYRIFGLVHQIVPAESTQKKKGETPTRRPAAHIRPDEVAWLLGTAGLIVLLGQCVWWLANNLEFVPMEGGLPLRWADTKAASSVRYNPPPGEFRPGQNRFFLLAGGLFFGGLLARLVFGYWRLRAMSATEGAMVLTDTSWAESHRERVRVEKWRIWGRRRAERQAVEAERAEAERQAKAERARARHDREADERRNEERRRLARRGRRPKRDEDD